MNMKAIDKIKTNLIEGQINGDIFDMFRHYIQDALTNTATEEEIAVYSTIIIMQGHHWGYWQFFLPADKEVLEFNEKPAITFIEQNEEGDEIKYIWNIPETFEELKLAPQKVQDFLETCCYISSGVQFEMRIA